MSETCMISPRETVRNIKNVESLAMLLKSLIFRYHQGNFTHIFINGKPGYSI
jgi:hypothetical protein